MMSERRVAAFESNARFDRREGTVFDLDGFDFEAWVRVGDTELVVVQELPMLDAVVEDETVAPVVEDGWFETFERRVEDVTRVLDADVQLPKVSRDGDIIRVETRLVTEASGPDDAIAIVNYVEGTWVEGIIPGYDYDDRVQSIRTRARDTAQDPTGSTGPNDT